jgi:formylglycine-generating enzyme required for sulfatase activity
VRAYTNWRSAREHRVYGIPTMSEFEYAARACRPDVKYPWGNEPPSAERPTTPLEIVISANGGSSSVR